MNAIIEYFGNKLFKNHKNKQHIIENLTQNLLCHTIGVICLIIIVYNSDKEYLNAYVTFLFVSYIGYMVHYWSHNYNLSKMMLESNHPFTKYVKDNHVLRHIVLVILSTFDFHSMIHHDSSINKYPANWIAEFMYNILYQGGLLYLFSAYICNISITLCNHTFRLHHQTILFWTLLYATFHNINYFIREEQNHIYHHIDPTTNFGPDIYDIYGDTKYDLDYREDYNDVAINIIIITILFLLYNKQFS